MLTGDTLFVGDVGRPDLLASAGADLSAEALARRLYRSLRGKLLVLPNAQNARIWTLRSLIDIDPTPAPNGGSRVKNSETLLTKRDLPRPGGRNNRIPAIFAGHRSGPALLRTGNRYRRPASSGRVAAGEQFRVTGGREPQGSGGDRGAMRGATALWRPGGQR